jgi:hypothetical protein
METDLSVDVRSTAFIGASWGGYGPLARSEIIPVERAGA